MMENLGLLAALGAALAWGSYVVPVKKSPAANLVQFQALMTVGVFLFALTLSPIIGYSINFNPYGLLSGLMWALANAVSLVVIKDLGISRGVPLWISLVIITSFLWGVLVFNELPTGILMGLLGVALIVLGVILVGNTGNAQSGNTKRGIVLAILSGVIFGSQFVPLKFSHLPVQEFFFPMSAGILVTGLGIALLGRVKFKNEAIISSLSSGIIWNTGNLLAVIAISSIGLAKGFPITQVSILVAVLWGLLYFKEITSKGRIAQVLIGAVVLLLGVFVLSQA